MNKLITTGVVLAVLLITCLATCTKVGPKEAAFRVNNAGNYRGVTDIPLVTGYQLYLPWYQHIEKVGTTMEHIVWTDSKDEGEAQDQALSVFCYGGAGFHINVGLNIHVIAESAPKMWLKWKNVDVQEIMKSWGRNMVRGVCNEASSKMTVDSLLNNFTALEGACRNTIRDSLAHYGFALDGFNILDKPKAIDPKLEDAINQKIIARQNAERTVMENQSAIAESNKKISTARGDSASAVIEAAGKAEAIKLLHEQLTPTYVEYIKWLNAAPDLPRVPSTQLGSGTQVLYSQKE